MRQHLHFYDTKGVCRSSIPLPERTIHPSIETSLQTRIQYVLIGNGYCLKRWLETEQAGIATSGETQVILRVKSDGTMRNMLPIGATRALADIRRDGVDVESITGLTV